MRFLFSFIFSISLYLVPILVYSNITISYTASTSSTFLKKKKTTKFTYKNIEQELDTTVASKIKMHNYIDQFIILEERIKYIDHYIQFTIDNDIREHKLFSIFLKGKIYSREGKQKDAIKLYQDIIKLAKESQNKNDEFLGYSGLLYTGKNISRIDSVSYYNKQSQELLPIIKDPFYKALNYKNLASYYIEKEEFLKALDLLLIIDKSNFLEESNIRLEALTNLGWMFEHLNYQERAKIFYLKAIKIAEKNNSLDRLNFLNLKLGHIELFNLDNPTAALEKYTALETVYKDTKTYKEGILYGTMGFAYLKLGKKEEALSYLIKSSDFLKKNKFDRFLCLPYTYLTHYYVADNQFKKAIESGEIALELIESQKLFSARKLILLDKLAEAHKQVGNTERALSLLEELNTIKNTLEIKKNNVAFIESSYELDENKEQLEIAELNNQLLQKNRYVYVSLLSILSLGLFFTLYLYYNRQKTAKKLKQLDVLKTNFFTNISHEFRTPLTLISSPIQEALDEPGLSSEKRNHFEIASKNTDRLLELVDQLLVLSKIESGNLKLHLEKGDIIRYIKSLVDSFSYLAKQKEIDFKTNIEHLEKEAWFDRDALEKITSNLISNAIKYTPQRGEIVINASIENDKLLLQIKNTGKGLTKKQQVTLFKRFYQTDEQNEGVGVGLALVKELVAMHKGKITVDSILNEWTIFNVSLCIDKEYFKNALIITNTVVEYPKAKKELFQEYPEQPNVVNSELPILLIVEDNIDLQLVLSDLFKKDYKVITANNGEEGVNMALECIPDLIISDVMMPIKDGVELTKTLKADERTSHIPIILLTAKAGDENKLIGIDKGADDYITKPFNQKILKAKVVNLIAIRKKLQSRYTQEVVLKPRDIAITSIDQLFLEKVEKVLDKNLIDPSFNTEVFSVKINMSRMQLHRKLKALLGLTTSEFIRSERLKIALKLLKQEGANVSQVGYSVGFNDPNYFSKCFKEAYNYSPSTYLKETKTAS